jgi:hypothetical protein
MRTIAEPVEGTEVRIEPADSPGIKVNNVSVTLESVCKADVRVDLVDDTVTVPTDRTRSFVVEHVLGPLGLRGVTAANVVGIRDDWDFARPEHRFCYGAELPPSCVVGHPAGLPNPALATALGQVEVVERASQPRQTVSEPVSFNANGGDIKLHPREDGAGIRFEATYGEAEITAEVDPHGETDETLIDSVTNSTTPYLSPNDEEAVTHAIADLVSDIAVIGGFDDLVVEANLAEAYHALTIGAAKKAHSSGLVEQRPS